MAAEAGSSAGLFERNVDALLRDPPRAKVQPVHIAQAPAAAESIPPEIKKWPPLATLAFIVVTCGAFWTAVILGVSQLI